MKTIGLFIILTVATCSAQLGMVDKGIVVPDGLIGYYTFDPVDNRNQQAFNRVSTANTGFITNSCVQSNGIISGGLAFDGATTAVSFTNGAIFGTGSGKSFSVCFWMYPKAIANYCNVIKTGQTIAGKAFIIGPHDTTHYYIDTWFGDYEPSGPAPLNAWTHVALTADGTNFRLYCNSVLTNTTAKNPDFTAGGTFIGQGAGLYPRPFNGVLDDVRLYNRTLTASEISQIFKSRH